MPSWFTLDDVNCEDLGIHVLEHPPIVVAQRRVRTFTVPGGQDAHIFDGDWGYEDMEKEVRCMVEADASPEMVSSFLTPSFRRIIFGNEPAFAYTGFCQNAVEIAKILQGREEREFTAVFRCQPFKALAWPDEPIELLANGTVYHPGTARCYPKIQVEGSGTVTITTHAVDKFKIKNLTAGNPVIIDSAAMICTDETGTVDWSAKTDGDYPYLDPGDNRITFTSGVSRLLITPNFLWL